jgi:hypothetical protein
MKIFYRRAPFRNKEKIKKTRNCGGGNGQAKIRP